MFEADGLLFDFDGTLVDSAVFYDRIWSDWAIENGFDPAPILAVHHGRRFPDTLKAVGLGHLDTAKVGAELYARSLANTDGLALVPGVATFLNALPKARWGIVTSAGERLVRSWLAHFNLPVPDVLVSAEMVTRGKPEPDGYLLGAQRLGFAPARCIVFEDAPAGITAGQTAGCTVIALATTHRGRLPAGLRSIDNYSNVQVSVGENGLKLAL